MMNNLSDFRNYKKAKIILKDLENLVKVIDLAIAGLSKFPIYITAIDSMIELKKNRTLTKINIDKCKKIIEQKGKLKNER